MSTLVESLRRLYHKNPPKVTLEKLEQMLAEEKITQAEFDYIVAP